MTDGLISIPARKVNGHKGDFGTVVVVGGQSERSTGRMMIGGPALAALGALRTGAGLAVLAMPESILREALTIAPSATGVCLPTNERGELIPSGAAEAIDSVTDDSTVVAIGPGLGTSNEAQKIVIRLVAQTERELVIDADALNCLSKINAFDKDLKAHAILTPHPGEWSRLAEALRISGNPIDPTTRPAAADALARRLGCIVVLKGAGTVVSNGLSNWTCAAGNASLATGGSGDVLTGIVAGLLAQFGRLGQAALMSMFEIAKAGVLIHALSADRWRDRIGAAGMLASDLLDEIPHVLDSIRRKV